jgi:hypothetical protein
MPIALSLDLQYTIIDLVLSSCIGWSHHDTLRLLGTCTLKEVQARAFLATCCLVNKEWYDYAHRQLYSLLRLTPAVRQSLQASPRLAHDTKHVIIDARVLDADRVERSAVELLLSTGVAIPNLRGLIMCENSYTKPTLPKSVAHGWTYASLNLTHLVYLNGTSAHLAGLLAVLPNLTSLHIGRTAFAGTGANLEQLQPPAATCKLQEIVFQSVYHFDNRYLDCLLGSSKESLKAVTFAYYGSLLNECLEYISSATHLTLTVKENRFGVPEPAEEYRLESLLTKFKHLSCVSGYTSLHERFTGPKILPSHSGPSLCTPQYRLA